MSDKQEMPLPISFNNKEKVNITRSTAAITNRSIQDNALNLKTSQISGKQSVESPTKDFGGKSNEIMTLEIDEHGTKQKGAKTAEIYSIEVIQNDDNKGNEVEPEVYNDISTFHVENTNIAQTLDKLSTILWSYSSEIDFQIDSDKNEIKNGVVFIKNYYCVFFKVYIYAENDKKTRLEFRRESGDALASAKFLGDIKTLFFGAGNNDDNDSDDDDDYNDGGDTLIGLELNADGLELKINDDNAENKEMMMIHEALIADDKYIGDLEENAESYLYLKLCENAAISKDIIDDKILCQTLMDKTMLLHDDISVVRASLLILKKFVNIHNDLLIDAENTLFLVLNKLLNDQKYNLVKIYAVGLLYALSQIKWGLNDELKGSLKESIKKCQDGAKNSKNYDEKMFNTIYKKL